MAYEESGVHHAQEFENRFWTIFALLMSTALFFAKDSPLAFGLWSPRLGLCCVFMSGYFMHLWDRYLHRIAISKAGAPRLRPSGATSQSLLRLQDLGIPVSAQLDKINECLTEIDQLLIPSTINNFINQRFVMAKEREIIQIIEECDARALNYLIGHVKLGLLFYKIKDHNNFNGKNRTELINLLAVERLPILTVISRVILLHSLQLLKLRANHRAEFWVQNILCNTHQDDLSELKTLTDAKGDYFSMNKLIYDDIRSESVRQTILAHIRREAAIQHTHVQMGSWRKKRVQMQFRKVLSDVDDTLCSSGGMYPAGIDKRYTKKTVYPGVLAFYRELDLGTEGPDEWEDDQVGNLVFLSARPHVYRDMSEKRNFAKFARLQADTLDGRKGMHTMPSLLAGDISSGSQYVMTNDFEPLAKKKFDNFKRYVSIYPEYKHLFVCDNGQGDVRASEMMFKNYPYEFEAAYVHVVQDLQATYGFFPDRWRQTEFSPCFFRCYPEAALHAASQNPPLIRIKGLQRICQDAVKDFLQLKLSQFTSEREREDRRLELNQAIGQANRFLLWHLEGAVELIPAEQLWREGEMVRTPYGAAIIQGFDPVTNLYDVSLDWRPLDVQLEDYIRGKQNRASPISREKTNPHKRLLSTVVETVDEEGAAASGEEAIEELEPEHTAADFRPDIRRQEVGESSAESHDCHPNARSIQSTEEARREVPNLREEEGDTSAVTSGEQPARDSESRDRAAPGQRTEPPKASMARAQVSGRNITKYTPPVLPKIDTKKKTTTIFPFLKKTPEPRAPVFRTGEEVETPFGPATVIEHRSKTGVVVVSMLGWTAKAYLQQKAVKRLPKSLFASLIRQLSGNESSQQPKPLEVPYPRGTSISTPFGDAKVSRPILATSKSFKISSSATIELSIESWTLSNGVKPKIYCTASTAQAWKEHKPADGSSIFSALNTIVTSSRSLLEPFLPHKKVPVDDPPKTYPRYFENAAAVSTRYGDGVVRQFRESDGIYEVSLVRWKLGDGSHPTVYTREENLLCRIAEGCLEGNAVLTNLGLTGNLASVQPTTGVHIVSIPSANRVCYLQPESIIRSLKAAVGEEVVTPYGDGRIRYYDTSRDVYTIDLAWNAVMYATKDSFDRSGETVQDADGGNDVSWLFRFLFFRGREEKGGRSRSNSIVSATQSTRSGA